MAEGTKSKKAEGGKPRAARGGLAQTVTPDATLAAVVGGGAATRAEITKKIWEYVKSNKLQDSKDKRMINADAKLKSVFGGKDKVSMFEMTKLVNQHVS
ncbi:MAG: SWIB/MDM2 domain-containing protein [Myxococcota bacterium]